MSPKLLSIVAAIMGVAIGGMLIRKQWIRILLWALSLPAVILGALALAQGGIAEKFTSDVLIAFCATAFAPMVGCVTGEFLRVVTRKNGRQ